MYRKEAKDMEGYLQILLDVDMPRRPALATPANADEASPKWEEIACCSETGYLTAVCRRCGDEEACVVVLPCHHLSLCLTCESEASKFPDCGSAKSGWFWHDMSE